MSQGKPFAVNDRVTWTVQKLHGRTVSMRAYSGRLIQIMDNGCGVVKSANGRELIVVMDALRHAGEPSTLNELFNFLANKGGDKQ